MKYFYKKVCTRPITNCYTLIFITGEIGNYDNGCTFILQDLAKQFQGVVSGVDDLQNMNILRQKRHADSDQGILFKFLVLSQN